MQSIMAALNIKPREVISFIGGGGKTTAMFLLAKELSQKKQVLVTTTTKIEYLAQYVTVVAESIEEALVKMEGMDSAIIVLGRKIEGNKLHGLPKSWLNKLKEHFDYILIEADGAAHKALKGYAHYEPVIPGGSSLVVALVGMNVEGKALDNANVHRAALLSQTIGVSNNAIIVPWMIARVCEEMAKLTSEQAPGAKKVVFLNQVEPANHGQYLRLAGCLVGEYYDIALIGRLLPTIKVKKIDKGITVPVVAIVLAAGMSARMGNENKLMLPWRNTTIIRQVVETTVKVFGNDLLVVGGHQYRHLTDHLSDLTNRIIYNEDYRCGQSTSVKKGLAKVNNGYIGAMFLLGDQPLIQTEILESLLTAFKINQASAVYPTYNNKRGNPTIFHRKLFSRLMQIEGDRGGRLILEEKKADVLAVPVNTNTVLKDIDTKEDWQQLR